jgi:ribosomal protein S18 acetylase RimI-like enzyme
MIRYTDSPAGVTADQLAGFFVGWPDPPLPETLLKILEQSAHVHLAIDESTGKVVGFITAITDRISCAYIPHLEVLPPYQQQGIGSTLVRRMLDTLRHLYMIDLVCDPGVQPFYLRLGMQPGHAMLIRNYDRQSCAPRQ